MNRRKVIQSGLAIGLSSLMHTNTPLFARQSSTPSADAAPPDLTGILANEIDSLPRADEDEVQIVVQSAPLGRYVGFIIHNNSGSSVGYGEVKGIARSSAGDLAGVLDTDIAAPYEIEAGQYCLGYASFDKDLPIDTTIELTPEFETVGSSWTGYVDLTVSEVSITDDRVIGVVENHTEIDASSLSHIIGIFLDDHGEIVGVTRTYVDGSNVDAGSFATFNTRVDAGNVTGSYLFASRGREG